MLSLHLYFPDSTAQDNIYTFDAKPSWWSCPFQLFSNVTYLHLPNIKASCFLETDISVLRHFLFRLAKDFMVLISIEWYKHIKNLSFFSYIYIYNIYIYIYIYYIYITSFVFFMDNSDFDLWRYKCLKCNIDIKVILHEFHNNSHFLSSFLKSYI